MPNYSLILSRAVPKHDSHTASYTPIPVVLFWGTISCFGYFLISQSTISKPRATATYACVLLTQSTILTSASSSSQLYSEAIQKLSLHWRNLLTRWAQNMQTLAPQFYSHKDCPEIGSAKISCADLLWCIATRHESQSTPIMEQQELDSCSKAANFAVHHEAGDNAFCNAAQ